MFIEELELIGYHRLALNQFDRIKIKFTKKVQVLLGTNGSGKSSLLAEMSPLPPDHKNYSKDGMKRIVVRHRGKRYILTSKFSPVKHSFMMEGDPEDLNPGGTLTVQKELVKRVFGIDAVSHSLATGKHEFHSMDTNPRRDWFRLLSDTNFDYAIGVYNKLRIAARDNSGALKLARNKMVSWASRMMPANELEALEKDCEELYKVVELLIENRNSPVRSTQESSEQLEVGLRNLETMATGVLTSMSEIDRLMQLGLVEKIEDASSMTFFIANRLAELRERRNTLFEENKQCQDVVDLHEKTKTFQVATISVELDQLKLKKQRLEKALVYKFPIFMPREMLTGLEVIAKPLSDMSHDIPINKDGKYTREGFKTLVAYRETLVREVDLGKLALANINERLEHQAAHEESPDVTCPKCEFSWKPNYNAQAVEALRLKVEEITRNLAFTNATIVDVDLKMEDFQNWLKHIEAVKELAAQHGHLRDFWSLIMKKEILFENPRQIPMIVQGYREELLNQLGIEETEAAIDAEHEKLDMAITSKGLDHQQAVITLQRIGEELNYIANEDTRLNAMKDTVNKLSFLVKKVQNLEDKISNQQKDLDNIVETYVEDIRRVMYNNVLRSFQSDLALKEKAINDEKMQHSSLRTLENEIASLERNQEAYKLVLKELSPTEGIIAEGLFGYMKLFIRNMNKFIATVWSYPLVVHPCSTEEGKIELNYKFPLMVNKKDSVRNDISEGSSSMREIINLAFTVSALKSIGLGSATLFLDEFGATMDPVHKQQTTRMISDIVENEKFEQIFLISHDISQYGSIDNTEVCILNAANVIIPHGCVYNQHVETQ